MTVDDLADYIVSIAGVPVITYLPGELDDVVMTRFTGGPRDADLLSLRQPSFQVFIRDRDGVKAEELAANIDRQLHGANAVIGGYSCSVYSKTEPAPLGQDDKKRWMYSLNFELIYQS